LGLVDRIGNLQDTIDIAAQMVGIVGKPNVVYPVKKKLSFWDLLFNDMASALVESLKEKGFELNYRLSAP
jgi:ClpP class serine protease